MNGLPETQFAVQLTGPSELRLNKEKKVYKPGPYQIVAKIEAAGLCFSDLKLLKQFSEHARKGKIISGISQEILDEIPSYVPENEPTVPGHEAVVRIVEVGKKVSRYKIGERCLVQTDYRELPTANSNGSFGYNFEGALQEYVLMDERVIIDPKTDERFLIPVDEKLSASAVCLVEPWACVEDSYVNPERQTIKAGGRLLVVVEKNHQAEGVENLLAENKPDEITTVNAEDNLDSLPNEGFDDIIYFGAKKETVEILNDKLAPKGIFNVVTSGEKFNAGVSVGIGRLHYGMTRWIGTISHDAGESYNHIPKTVEIRSGEKIIVVGAAGPMGQMHVIRDICTGIQGISMVCTDFDDSRLEMLAKKSAALAKKYNVEMKMVNPQKSPVNEKFSYYALMVPVGKLVADAIKNSTEDCLINVFAGIPAPTKQEIDMDTYIENRCYMFGTSGSVIRDMKIVLEKIEKGELDTNCSVDAVSGMAGAVDGLHAVELRTCSGKIIVYPELQNLELTLLSELDKKFPSVAAKLDNGGWTKEAENELLNVAGR